MRFHYFGTLENLHSLKTAELKFKKVERKDVKIAIIDDDTFPYLSILTKHKFNIDTFKDVTNIESMSTYDIILCDIQGVGKELNTNYQGAYLLKEIYERFPSKVLISYTAHATDITFNKYLQYAEFSMKKDASSEDWVEKLDQAISLVSNLENRWVRTRDMLLKRGVSLFELSLLEDEFVYRVINRKTFENFPPPKITKSISDEIEPIIDDFCKILKLLKIVSTNE